MSKYEILTGKIKKQSDAIKEFGYLSFFCSCLVFVLIVGSIFQDFLKIPALISAVLNLILRIVFYVHERNCMKKIWDYKNKIFERNE